MFTFFNQIKNFGIIKHFYDKKIDKDSKFYEQSSKIALSHYRYLLKTVPNLYHRRLQQRSIYIEICHLFHQSKVLGSIHETRLRIEHLNQIVNEIKGGDYQNIGVYLPARSGQFYFMDSFFTDWPKRMQ